MTEDLTRRRLFGLAGASVAGLSLAGCAIGSKGQRTALTTTASTGQGFVTQPGLKPPAIKVTHFGTGSSTKYVFLNAPYSGPGHGGTIILDSAGDLVWFGPNTAAHHKMDFDTQVLNGEPVLTWWEGLVVQGYGKGQCVIADSSYRIKHVITPKGILADLHEFNITPDGKALITAYRTHTGVDLSARGGPKSGYLISGVFQVIDIATGKLEMEWDSKDHVELAESYEHLGQGDGSKKRPYNYFHINSVAPDDDGNWIVSGRNTWTIYKVERTTGKIMWRLNGKKSDFSLGPGVKFFWQHHVRPHSQNRLTIFDNGAKPVEEQHSRALIVDLHPGKKHATLHKAYIHPDTVVLAGAMGSAQLRPDGHMFVGWGTQTRFSEFAEDGRLILDGTMELGAPSYRAFAADWKGHPAHPPVAAAKRRSGGSTVYASWNGATSVARWRVLAGKSATSLSTVGSVRRAGFETAIEVHNNGPWFAVEAIDAGGHALAKSAPVKIS
jgi:hypothetical protein